MVVRPGTHEVQLAQLHLARPMLSACDGYEIYSNASLPLAFFSDSARPHLHTEAIQGSMDSPLVGWPAERPVSFSAANSAVFLQAWHAIFASKVYKDFDWTVKVDPDTVFFPDRLRTLLRGHSASEPVGFFDGGGACRTGEGGIGVLSRAGVQALEHFERALPLMHIEQEDSMLQGALNNWGKNGQEPNLLLNPVPDLDCSKAPWKAAYHPYKDARLADWCLAAARQRPLPSPSELHSVCL